MNEKSIALGTFDGFHIGHEAVLTLANKSKYDAFVLLFLQHPLSVICGKTPAELLTDSIRENLMNEIGISPLYIDFNEIHLMDYKDFFYEILLKKYNAKELSCGENYTFGKDGKGNITTLTELCNENHIKLNIAPTMKYNDQVISSTKIRQLLNAGEIEDANNMLGRPFSYDFKVVSGDRRGRQLGFPTINQFFPDDFVQLKKGVYASCVFIDGKYHAAVTDFGTRPTIGTSSCRSETCILDFSGNLYNKHIEVNILKYIRSEKKFSNLTELKNQIAIDSSKSREIFNNSIAKVR